MKTETLETLHRCPSCGSPLVQSFNWDAEEAHHVHCVLPTCQSEAAKKGASGRTFEEAATKLRKAVEK